MQRGHFTQCTAPAWWENTVEAASQQSTPKAAAAGFLDYMGFAAVEVGKTSRYLRPLTFPWQGTGFKPTCLFPSGMLQSVLSPFSRKTQECFPQFPCAPDACGLGLRYPTVSKVEQGMSWWGDLHTYSLVPGPGQPLPLVTQRHNAEIQEEQATQTGVLLREKGCPG